jgi:hypothetical protein
MKITIVPESSDTLDVIRSVGGELASNKHVFSGVQQKKAREKSARAMKSYHKERDTDLSSANATDTSACTVAIESLRSSS